MNYGPNSAQVVYYVEQVSGMDPEELFRYADEAASDRQRQRWLAATAEDPFILHRLANQYPSSSSEVEGDVMMGLYRRTFQYGSQAVPDSLRSRGSNHFFSLRSFVGRTAVVVAARYSLSAVTFEALMSQTWAHGPESVVWGGLDIDAAPCVAVEEEMSW